MSFDPAILIDNWPVLARGFAVTVMLSALAIVLGFVMAIPIAALKLARHPVLRLPASLLIEVVRGMPFLVLLYLLHFGLPFFGPRLPATVTGTFALALFGAVYFAEVIRAAVLALPRGQMESGRAVGMTRLQSVRHIIAPQLVPGLLPPSTNIAQMLIKESAVLSSITVPELTYSALLVQGQTFSPVEVFVATGTLYWVLSHALATASTRGSRRHARRRPQGRIADRFLSLDAFGPRP
ncbi:amino acid ABC transporter permease [Ancylobacter mangrovi]|uniref:amino acid ABC transporter permease n=1 Tax=Ancylobacter mangrovi TaxID=2972472 RepID=UPI0021614CEE|nr:amino acid ABC transporter permease [Ancylobacter mangrovi]MCS0505111.1 amino acid ABC transporter permease [Ancylobacter mangrovi]